VLGRRPSSATFRHEKRRAARRPCAGWDSIVIRARVIHLIRALGALKRTPRAAGASDMPAVSPETRSKKSRGPLERDPDRDQYRWRWVSPGCGVTYRATKRGVIPLRGRHLHQAATVYTHWITSFRACPMIGETHLARPLEPPRSAGTVATFVAMPSAEKLRKTRRGVKKNLRRCARKNMPLARGSSVPQ